MTSYRPTRAGGPGGSGGATWKVSGADNYLSSQRLDCAQTWALSVARRVCYPAVTPAQAHLYVALSGAIPALVAMWLVDRLDAKRPEPLKLRVLVTVFGAVMFIPAAIIEVLVMHATANGIGPQWSYQGGVFGAFVVAAATEEACKILVVYWLVWKRPEFDERMDGIVYAARAGLGFALVENIGYLLMEKTLTGQIEVWMLRAVLAVPGHAIWTGIIGALAAQRRFDRRGLGVVGGYLLAVAFHGTYDASVYLREPLRLEGYAALSNALVAVPFVLTIVGLFVLRGLARHALALDDRDAALHAARSAGAVVAAPVSPTPRAPAS
jgi:RsiW-degrading membrane proteinase PrsW (M82 family)